MKPAKPDKQFDFQNPSSSSSPCKYQIFNIGNGNPIPLMKYVEAIENELGIIAIKEFYPMQKGDVMSTSANTDLLFSWTNFKPKTSIEEGIKNFVYWYRDYYNI